MITGRIIRQLRNARGIGIRDLEKLTGINRGNLSKIERGSGFGPTQIRRIAAQFETTPAVIFILSEILVDQLEIVENAQELSQLSQNLTRLLNAYVLSPREMQARIDAMLASSGTRELTSATG
ncbi:MAG: helix-turn-helix domain-containing protein [Thiotrichales bacterium]|nr:helix-turn-helix domain-containing protein [Thiotrichales bacterium]